jgi:hypothetical protein
MQRLSDAIVLSKPYDSPMETIVFPQYDIAGVPPPAVKFITIYNFTDTDPASVSFSVAGSGAGAFTLSVSGNPSPVSIDRDDKVNLDITPSTTITVGIHEATLTIASGGFSASIPLSILAYSTADPTPDAGDYTITNLTQKYGNLSAVSITPATAGVGAVTNIYYAGSATIPQAPGTYAVTFNVAAGTGWNPATGLSAGNLVVDPYTLGETGPGGGKIFYVAPTSAGFTVQGYTGATGSFATYTAYYLEAAPADMPGSFAWASSAWTTTDIYLYSGTGETAGSAIGTGRKNTAFILFMDATAPAAYACKNYNVAPYDWFLPSFDELKALYDQRVSAGNTINDFYWSSTQQGAQGAYYRRFDNGTSGNNVKYGTAPRVRPIRAF